MPLDMPLRNPPLSGALLALLYSMALVPETSHGFATQFTARARTVVELPKYSHENSHEALDECSIRRYAYDSQFWVDGDIVREERKHQVLARSDITRDYSTRPTGFEGEFRGNFSRSVATLSNWHGRGMYCPHCGVIEFDDKPFCEEWGGSSSGYEFQRHENSISAPPTTHIYDLKRNIHFILDMVPGQYDDAVKESQICSCEEMPSSTFVNRTFQEAMVNAPALARVEGSYALGQLVGNTLATSVSPPISNDLSWPVPTKIEPSSIAMKHKESGTREFTAKFTSPYDCKAETQCHEAQKVCGPKVFKRDDYLTYPVLLSRTYQGRWKTTYKDIRDDEYLLTVPSKTSAIFRTSYNNAGHDYTPKDLRRDEDCITDGFFQREASGTDLAVGYERTYHRVHKWYPKSDSGGCAECADEDATKGCMCAAVPRVCLEKSPMNKCNLI